MSTDGANLRRAIAQYNILRQQTKVASDAYWDAPSGAPGEQERRDAKNAAITQLINAEKAVAEMVVSLVGSRPEEYRPVAVIIDGLPVAVYLDDNDDAHDIRVVIPEPEHVVGISLATG
jgi:hypothetical protein